MNYILRRAEQSALCRDIELSPLKKEIEAIFIPSNIDQDCDTIDNLLVPYKKVIKEAMSKDKYHKAFEIFLEILESLSYHFVKDEHFCYFDDMYSPDYTCSNILDSIIAEIKTGKVSSEDVAYLDSGIKKIAKMEAYEDYGCPFCIADWENSVKDVYILLGNR